MKRYALSPESSTLDVWTYKEGLLSAIAHDLQISATGLEGEGNVGDGKFSLKVSIPVDKLTVRGAVHDGKTTPLSDKDRREIEKTARGPSILDSLQHPHIVYTAEGEGDPLASGGALEARGTLNLRGAMRPVSIQLRVARAGEGLQVTGEVRFKQSHFGIKPHSAMLGTLKVKDEVRISWSLALVPTPEAARS